MYNGYRFPNVGGPVIFYNMEYIDYKDPRYYDITDLPDEEWKPVSGHENFVMVSNYGRVKRKGCNSGNGAKKEWLVDHILKPTLDCKKINVSDGKPRGYLRVTWTEGSRKIKVHKKLHCLVAEHFISNPDDKPEVNHISEEKQDNRVINLEWTTHDENMKHGTRNQRVAKANTNNPKTSKPVGQYTLSGAFVKEYPSANEAQRDGFSQGNISQCCEGSRSQHKGFKWAWA